MAALPSRGQIEGIGTAPRSPQRMPAGQVLTKRNSAQTCESGDRAGCTGAWLRRRYGGARVLGVGHRVVHGGVQYAAPTIVTPTGDRTICIELEPLAPLHQPHNLAAIEAVAERLPDVPQVACFDTSFHRTQSPLANWFRCRAIFAIAGVQRYGFHGLSYEYIATVLPRSRPRSPRDESSSRTWEAAPACAP